MTSTGPLQRPSRWPLLHTPPHASHPTPHARLTPYALTHRACPDRHSHQAVPAQPRYAKTDKQIRLLNSWCDARPPVAAGTGYTRCPPSVYTDPCSTVAHRLYRRCRPCRPCLALVPGPADAAHMHRAVLQAGAHMPPRATEPGCRGCGRRAAGGRRRRRRGTSTRRSSTWPTSASSPSRPARAAP